MSWARASFLIHIAQNPARKLKYRTLIAAAGRSRCRLGTTGQDSQCSNRMQLRSKYMTAILFPVVFETNRDGIVVIRACAC